ncbi:flavin-containing monooxygenase [Litorimonas sp. WD9-15]|uniref:flavin-containing monooxygenase n=1 Tax=Litorimonas sp. WD9-15 TaxID=3418716 RepID=UPI003D0391DB
MGKTHFETVIIGSGFGGLCMGIKLKEAGREDFVIVEKAEEVGGTWRENTYPGAECDIASALYSYSFAPNPAWDFKWAKQKQIHEYQRGIARDYGLYDHLKFGRTVISASFADGVWTTTFRDGEVLTSRFLVSAIGQLHIPKTPEIEGAENFEGASFHSAQWDNDFETAGKNIGVIGNAASAIQLIPELAEVADKLTVYHRTPNWIIPKKDRPYSKLEKWLGKKIPALGKLYRFSLFAQGEYFVWRIIQGKPLARKFGEVWVKSGLKKHIKDPELRAKMLPDYPMGARRILLSDKIYPAFARENVEVVTKGLDRFTKDGLVTKDGTERQHDLVVYATGFHTNPFLKEIDVRGEGGVSLKDHWAEGAQAYMGTMTDGFPNLFILYGPNTNTGHTSIIYKLENQIGYVVKLIEKTAGVIAVKPEAESEFSAEMQRRLKDLAWSKVDASWYKVGDKVPNNWPGSALEFKRRFKTPDWEAYEITE